MMRENGLILRIKCNVWTRKSVGRLSGPNGGFHARCSTCSTSDDPCEVPKHFGEYATRLPSIVVLLHGVPEPKIVGLPEDGLAWDNGWRDGTRADVILLE